MTTELQDRLRDALAEAEIPSHRTDLVARTLLDGRRARRRRRTVGALGGAAAVAVLVVVTSTLVLEPPAPHQVVPVPAVPATATAARQTEPLDTGLAVSGSPVVLRLHEWEDGSSDLAIGLGRRIPDGADGLTPTTVQSSVEAPSGWGVAAVTAPDLTTTGTVVAFGHVEESLGVRVLVDGEPAAWNTDFEPLEGGGIMSFANGPFVFALAADVPALRGLDARDPRVAARLTVERRTADTGWVAVPKG